MADKKTNCGRNYAVHFNLFIKFDLDLVTGIFFLCMNIICCISFCLTKMMKTDHTICLVTQSTKKLCVLIKLKIMALNACSCPAFLICKKPIPVTEKCTALKLLLSF